MDKRTFIGLLLIVAVLIGFQYLNRPSEADRARWQAYHDSIAQVQKLKADSLRALQTAQSETAVVDAADSAAVAAAKVAKYGQLADFVEGSEQFYTLQNDLISIVVSNKGARIYSAELKDYTAYGDKALKLFDGSTNEFGFQFTHKNRSFYTNDLYFTTEGIKSVGDTATAIDLSVAIGDGALTYHYVLNPNTNAVDFSIESKNLGNELYISSAAIDLTWKIDMPALERSHKSEGMWSGIYYRYSDGDVEELGTTGNQDDNVNMNIDWVAYKDQYFSSVFIAEDKFAGAQLSSVACEPTDTIIKKVSSNLGVKFNFDNDKAAFKFLFLPNYFYTLESYEDLDLTELLPLGWGIFGWINEYFIIPVFKFLESAFVNYGLIILILTIIIKVIIFPFTFSSYKSQAKMRVLKPQVDAINERIPAEKAMERQQETMKLYKRAGVNPMGGCLPMLLQMPILIAAFRFFPAAVELRGQTFLWADDLASYDSILDLPFSIPFYGDHVSLFCLLMCITNVVYTRFNMQSQASSATMPGMKAMMYMMPVMLLFFFNDYPAGLCYYYFVSTLITVLQTIIIKASIDEKAILAKMEANKKKPQKKSRFMARYEEMMKEQQKKLNRR
ncbi:MAG: membrane protein insertase YidC [Bacteroidales bacterium]|nr:membrane protein insertase YidC [Bacteroidales bacterium]